MKRPTLWKKNTKVEKRKKKNLKLGAVMVTGTKNGISKPSSNFGPVCCINFALIHLRKTWILLIFLSVKWYGRLGSLALVRQPV